MSTVEPKGLSPRCRLTQTVAADRVAVTMFSKRMLEEGTAVALQQGEQLLAKLDAHAASGEPIDLQKAFFAFTMDTFAEIAFGAALDSQNTDHRFTQAFDTAQQLCNDRFGRPWFSLLKLLKTPSEAAIEREVGIMRGFALGIVQGRRRQKESGEPLGADLVSRFLASPSGGDMTDDELIDVVLNFIIAGRDTTACALSWASLRLLRAEDVQARMNAEVEAEIGKVVGVGKRPQLQELPASEVFNLVHKSLPYTRAVVSEALRLHPSVPKDGKYAVAADTLPDGTTVPRGCMMIWSNYVSAAALCTASGASKKGCTYRYRHSVAIRRSGRTRCGSIRSGGCSRPRRRRAQRGRRRRRPGSGGRPPSATSSTPCSTPGRGCAWAGRWPTSRSS